MSDDLMEETWQLTYPWEEHGGEGEDVAGSEEASVLHCIAFDCLKVAGVVHANVGHKVTFLTPPLG
jgi:hypothetical protein